MKKLQDDINRHTIPEDAIHHIKEKQSIISASEFVSYFFDDNLPGLRIGAALRYAKKIALNYLSQKLF
jgi:hypothetical protein